MEAAHAGSQGEAKRQRKLLEDAGVLQQQHRETAEMQARLAARTGDAYVELLAEGMRYASQHEPRRSARAYREAIALKPDEPEAYFNLGAALANSGHYVEAAQRFLEAKERYPVGSVHWARAIARAFKMLICLQDAEEVCAQVAKPEWWSDEGLKALSARVVRAAPDDTEAHQMRAIVLSGQCVAWEVGPRSVAELREALTHLDRAAALEPAPAMKAEFAKLADRCRQLAASR